jgi:hypothetical protein
MNPIKDVTGLSGHLRKMEKAENDRKVKSSNGQGRSAPITATGHTGDKVEISAIGKEMLQIRAESNRFQQTIEKAEMVEQYEIRALKNKVADGQYNDPNVIATIVDKLFELPNF